MAEYIEREAAVEIAEKYSLADGSVLGRHSGLADCIASEIATLPAADVVPVVRCKDCENAQNECGGMIICRVYKHVMWLQDFCSYGKRSSGGENNA